MLEELESHFALNSQPREHLTQMTKPYDDIDAVIRLLQEKEVDLELAARIGQGLLEQNKELRDTINELRSELYERHDEVQQMKRELLSKESLLTTLIDEQEEQESQQHNKYNDLVRRLADNERRFVDLVAENDALKQTLRTLTSPDTKSESCNNLDCRHSSPNITPTRATARPKPLKAVSPYKVEHSRASDHRYTHKVYSDDDDHSQLIVQMPMKAIANPLLPILPEEESLPDTHTRDFTTTAFSTEQQYRRPPMTSTPLQRPLRCPSSRLEPTNAVSGLASLVCTTVGSNDYSRNGTKFQVASAAAAMRPYTLAQSRSRNVRDELCLSPSCSSLSSSSSLSISTLSSSISSQLVAASPSASTSSSLIFGVLVILLCCLSPKRSFDVNIGPRLDSIFNLTLD